MELVLVEMTRGQMEDAAHALAYCVRNGHWEDAMNHLLGLVRAVNTHQNRQAVEVREQVKAMAAKFGMREAE